MKLDILIDAWWNRTFPTVDLDNNGRLIPSPSEEEWKAGVRKDLKRLHKTGRKK